MTPELRERIERKRELRIGTLSCWLFGHKFIGTQEVPAESVGFKEGCYKKIIPLMFCIRCGIDKPSEVKNEKN